MNWTKETPARPGMYRLRNYRIASGFEGHADELQKTPDWAYCSGGSTGIQQFHLFMSEIGTPIDALIEGEWSGPIEPGITEQIVRDVVGAYLNAKYTEINHEKAIQRVVEELNR